MVLHIYRAISWSGEVRESAEMIPQWWPHQDIPYDQMWPDNQFWLHHVSDQDLKNLFPSKHIFRYWRDAKSGHTFYTMTAPALPDTRWRWWRICRCDWIGRQIMINSKIIILLLIKTIDRYNDVDN